MSRKPKLRATRSVSLWRNVFPISVHSRDTYTSGLRDLLESLHGDRLHSEDITKSIGTWLMVALALPSLGMPEGSFTLVFDGSPTPEHTSEVFRTLSNVTRLGKSLLPSATLMDCCSLLPGRIVAGAKATCTKGYLMRYRGSPGAALSFGPTLTSILNQHTTPKL
jgi:hypothetical protein